MDWSLVVETLKKGRVKLKNISTDKILRNTYNVSNLNVYSIKQGSSPNQFPDDSVKVLSMGAYNKRNRKAQVKKQTSL